MSATETVQPAQPGTRPANPPGRVRVVGAVFAVLFGLLLLRNVWLFTLAVHESGDSAANSIVTYQAKHFRLLVGNYSRVGFSHPGPAYFYVQAVGEWLLHDVAHLVPTPWNGEAVAVLALNAAVLAVTMSVLAGWYRSWPAIGLGVAVLLGYTTVYSGLFSTVWMPLEYIAPFLLLLTAGASVTAGRTGDLWALALAGGLLVHGHAEFLGFVPVLTAVPLVAAVRRRAPRAHWLAFAAVVAVFAVPIGLNLALHWPGEFGKYLSYGGSVHHGLGAALRYTLRAAPASVLLLPAAALVAWRMEAGPSRSLLRAGLALAVLATVAFTGYALRGIDDLRADYVGDFLRAVPLLLLLLLLVCLLPMGVLPVGVLPVHRAVTAGALAVAVVAALAVPAALLTPREDADEVPGVLADLRTRAAGRPVVVDLDHDAWPVLDALVIGGRRYGPRVCADDPQWTFMVTREFVCTDRERAAGLRVRLAVTPGGRRLGTVWLSGL